MNEERWFAEALDCQPGAEREAFLAQVCGTDAALRCRLDELLAGHVRSSGLLDRMPGSSDPTQDSGGPRPAVASQEVIGSVIAGRFELLELIGEGGMGDVYVAEQLAPVRRKVALKLVKSGLDSRGALARFDQERQALALMDHPNIAKVFDGGVTESGRPFFVMEYIKGIPITEYCDHVRMPIRERLMLLADACQAVQHAHQKGIIHRDLKPSNILVALYDGRPVVKVIDFGLAKLVDRSLTDRAIHTAHRVVMGTPLYMSPEQATLNNLDIDTRSDVYALGVVLYELLTGTTPIDRQRFSRAAWDEALRLVREEEPPKPSARLSSSQGLPSLAAMRQQEPTRLPHLLRGELDWIVMKALEKDRTRRYETASSLAADIANYITDDPVLARPPSALYRMRKFARRHKLVFATTAGIAASLVLGLVGTAWQASRAMRAERIAIVQRDEKETARREALASAEAERRAKENEFLQREAAETAGNKAAKEAAIALAVTDFLNKDLLGRADPEAEPDRDLKVKEVLDRAAKSITGKFDDQPLVESAIRATIGKSYSSLGVYNEAQKHFERAHELILRERGENHPDTLAADLDLAKLAFDRNQYISCRTRLDRIILLCRRNFGDDSRHTLRAVSLLGRLEVECGNNTKANSLLKDVLERQRRVGGEDQRDLLRTMLFLAMTCDSRDQSEYAEKLLTEVVTRSSEENSAEHPTTLAAITALANLYRSQGHFAEAEGVYARALDSSQRVLGHDHPSTVITLCTMSNFLCEVGQYLRAEELALDAVERAKRSAGAQDRLMLFCEHALAQCQILRGHEKSAQPRLEATVATAQRVLGAKHPETLTYMQTLSTIYRDQGQYTDALDLLTDVLAARQQIFGNDHIRTLSTMNSMARVLLKSGKPHEAFLLYQKVLDTARDSVGPCHLVSIEATQNIATLTMERGEPAKAEALLLKAIDATRDLYGADHPHLVTLWASLAKVYSANEEFERADSTYLQALEVGQRVLGGHHPIVRGIINNAAVTYFQRKQYEKAEKVFARLLEESRQMNGDDHPGTLEIAHNLAMAYGKQGRYDEAMPLAQRVCESKKRIYGDSHASTLRSMIMLAEMLVRCGQPDEGMLLGEQTLEKWNMTDAICVDALRAKTVVAEWCWRMKKLERSIPLFEEVVEAYRTRYGSNDRRTIENVANLGVNYRDAGRIDEALPLLENATLKAGDSVDLAWIGNQLFRTYGATGQWEKAEALAYQSLEWLEKAGSEVVADRDTALMLSHRLAGSLLESGESQRAVRLAQRSYDVCRAAHGDEHEGTQMLMRGLVEAYIAVGNYEVAEPLAERLVTLSDQTLGADHPVSVRTHVILCDVYERTGKLEDAERILRSQSERRKNAKGEESVEYAESLALLGRNLMLQRRFVEAQPILETAVEIHRRREPNLWTTFNAESMLGESLLRQHSYDEARPLLLSGYHGLKERESSIAAALRTDTLGKAVKRLIQLYDAVAVPDEADKWRRELESMEARAATKSKAGME